jgi:hypothetical protein
VIVQRNAKLSVDGLGVEGEMRGQKGGVRHGLGSVQQVSVRFDCYPTPGRRP